MCLICVEPFNLHTREVEVGMSSFWKSLLGSSCDTGVSHTPEETMPKRSAQARAWDSSSGSKGKQSGFQLLNSPVYTQGSLARSISVRENIMKMTSVLLSWHGLEK